MATSIAPDILALDFDGVICDGLIEYFQTAWRAYCQLFQPDSGKPPAGLAEQFYPLRPVVETGWEMPILLHALVSGVSPAAILASWPDLAQQLVTTAGLAIPEVAATVDGVRDAWIQADGADWLSQHRFYPGVIDRIHQAITEGVYPIIISTKEGRFIRELLTQQGLDLPPEQILGKEVKQPKYKILGELQANPPVQRSPAVTVWFIEDRLKALEAVERQPALASIQLFLADWGYNTAAEKAIAEDSCRIHRLSLPQLHGSFPQWLGLDALHPSTPLSS